MMPMARAMVTAVLLVAVGVDLLTYHSYCWRLVKLPWRLVARWHAAKGIQREIDAMDYGRVTPPNPALHFSGLSDLKASDQRDQIRVWREAREASRLKLVISGSSRRVQ